MADRYVVEHLNHLGIVAEVCRELGVAEVLDAVAPDRRQQVSVGTATVAMVLNGLGFSNRRLYLLPQFFADKPVEHLLGPGITADMLNDDCFGRTLDWLYTQDVTTLFARLAWRARQRFGVPLATLHADTTSFAVQGQYLPDAAAEAADADEAAPTVIAVTYGYSRDHRADLKQWMLALITAGDGIPQFLRPLNGNASDKQSLLAAVREFTQQVQESGEAPGVFVADSGLYSQANMTTLNAHGVQWISRVPETATMAWEAVHRTDVTWNVAADGSRQWWEQTVALPQGLERWIVVRTPEGEARATATMERQAVKDLTRWASQLAKLGTQPFQCVADAQAALTQAQRACPPWLQVAAQVVPVLGHAGRGRPKRDVQPQVTHYTIQATVTLDAPAVAAEAQARAAFVVGTNLLEPDRWPAEQVIAQYRNQSVVERGFAFLKDPLFLASSVFVKKPERIMALAFVMTLCLLVYKLAEVRVREQLQVRAETVPNQVKKPTQRPTMRWLFQCFEGIDLLHVRGPDGMSDTTVLRLTDLHRHVLHLLGPAYEKCYRVADQSAE